MRHFLSLSNLTAAEAGEQDLHSVVPRLFRVRQAGPGTSLLSLATTTTAFSAVRHPWDRLVSAYQVVNCQLSTLCCAECGASPCLFSNLPSVQGGGQLEK